MQLAGGTRSGGIHSFPSVGRLRSSRIPWRSSAQPAHTRWRGIGDSAQAAPVRCDAEQRRAESVRGATAELAEAPLAAPASSVRRQPSDGTGRRRPHGGASHRSLLAWPRPTLLARGATAIWRGPPPREATAATGGSLPLAVSSYVLIWRASGAASSRVCTGGDGRTGGSPARGPREQRTASTF